MVVMAPHKRHNILKLAEDLSFELVDIRWERGPNFSPAHKYWWMILGIRYSILNVSV